MTPEEELALITELLNEHFIPKENGGDIYSVYGRVTLLAEKAAQQSAHADGAYWCCPKCNSFVSVKFDICGLCKSPRR